MSRIKSRAQIECCGDCGASGMKCLSMNVCDIYVRLCALAHALYTHSGIVWSADCSQFGYIA